MSMLFSCFSKNAPNDSKESFILWKSIWSVAGTAWKKSSTQIRAKIVVNKTVLSVVYDSDQSGPSLYAALESGCKNWEVCYVDVIH